MDGKLGPSHKSQLLTAIRVSYELDKRESHLDRAPALFDQMISKVASENFYFQK